MDELLNAWAPRIVRAVLLPSSGGRFEVTLDGELLFSKAALERHPRPGEVHGLVAAWLGPPAGFNSLDTLNGFLADPELKDAMERSGVIGKPRIEISEQVEAIEA